MLLEARHEDGSPMSDQELRDELVTLLVAGHETTASSLAWMFSQLVQHPAILERLTEEIDVRRRRVPDRDDQRDPPPPAGAAEHGSAVRQQAGRDRRPASIEPGVSMVANGYLLHHDADIYPDPYRFDPERFVGTKPGTYTWIPFGGGRRRCLGAQFALLEMRVVARAIVDAHELAPTGAEERAARRNISIRPAHGARVRLRARAPRALATH